LRSGTHAAIEGVHDSLSQFHRIGIHDKIHPGLVQRIGATITIVRLQTDS
jgi:hypothetical protein